MKEMNNKISIIIPVYNAGHRLKKCVESVLSQTYQDIEVILVDDGSTDRSLEICEEFANRDARVIVCHKDNGGAGSARNVGLDKVSGRYLAFVDADDYVEADMYATVIEEMQDADVLICNWYQHNLQEKKRIKCGLCDGSIKNNEYVINLITQSTEGIGGFLWNKIFDCSKLGTLPKFKENLTVYEDMVWVLEILGKAECIRLSPYRGYHYIVSPESASHKWSIKNCISTIETWGMVGAMVDLDDLSKARRSTELINVMWDLNKSGIDVKEYWKSYKKVIYEDRKKLGIKQKVKIFLLRLLLLCRKQ